MAVREEGEFELILGNRQLLSVLFIVVVLLGVFFAMGFLAGRSTNASSASAKGSGDPADRPRIVEPAQPASKPVAESRPPEQASTAATTEPAKPKVGQAANDVPPPPPVSRPVTGGGFTEAPPAGTYLQAAATRREDAEAMLGLLKQDGLSGYVAPSPKADMFRVLIGPLAGNEEVAAAREKLGSRGIKQPYVIKY